MTLRLPVFVYGTLRPGQGNYQWALAGQTVSEVPASVAGLALYDGPGFPYAVLSDAPEDRVLGDVITIRDDAYDEVLARLDGLEGYRPGGGGLYDRVHVTAVTGTGAVEAWTYTVPPRRLTTVLSQHARIASGDWLH